MTDKRQTHEITFYTKTLIERIFGMVTHDFGMITHDFRVITHDCAEKHPYLIQNIMKD